MACQGYQGLTTSLGIPAPAHLSAAVVALGATSQPCESSTALGGAAIVSGLRSRRLASPLSVPRVLGAMSQPWESSAVSGAPAFGLRMRSQRLAAIGRGAWQRSIHHRA